MAQRIVTDVDGRVWTCNLFTGTSKTDAAHSIGRDVKLACTTPGMTEPVMLTVSWSWETMADKGLARMISRASHLVNH
jgi:hypothetical protein